MRILITGGPVPANLDAVKIITNKFKGGLMVKLVEDIADAFKESGGCEITYLTYRGSSVPREFRSPSQGYDVRVVYHDGFDDYRKKVLEMAKDYNAVILGAAVANLIPMNPWSGKFPSHDYKPGDIIPINFTIAPRVIDEVKASAPNTMVFGFKLLAGVDNETLVDAAYETLTGSHAAAVFANDAKNLSRCLVVTKERAVHPMDRDDIAAFIRDMIQDEYYSTEYVQEFFGNEISAEEKAKMDKTIDAISSLDGFFKRHGDHVFGTVAIRSGNGFITTARGKNELNQYVRVVRVLRENKSVFTVSRDGSVKATLNAPLLDNIFSTHPDVDVIAHGHIQMQTSERNPIPTLPYAPPGSVRDSNRENLPRVFNIESHGCFITYTKDQI